MADLIRSDKMELETPSPPVSPGKGVVGCPRRLQEVEVDNVTGSEALPKLPQKFSLAVVIPAKSVKEFELEYRDHIVEFQAQSSSPAVHPPRRTPKKNCNRRIMSHTDNPGTISDMDLSDHGEGAVSKETGPLPAQDHSETEDPITSDEEGSVAGNELDHLPTGLTLEDIQDPHEREKIKNWLEMGGSVAALAGSLQTDQVLGFLNSGLLEKTPIANFIDWNKVVFARTGTKVTLSREDLIREGFISQFPDYPIDKNNPDQAVDAYTVMQNIYLSVANDKATMQDFSTAPAETQHKMLWYRALYHDIRGKDIIAGIKAVEEKWKRITPRRYRSVAAIRQAFHYLCNTDHPTFPWPSSQDFFEATLDMIRVKEDYCMLVFEPFTERFLDQLKEAMVDAENRRITEWIAARTNEQFFDLLGTGLAPNFKDKVEVAPNPYSSVVE